MNTDKSHALAQRILFRLARSEGMGEVELTGLLRRHAMSTKAHPEHIRQRLGEAEKFIRALMTNAKYYGSSFSSGVFVDCENYFRDHPKIAQSKLTVLSTVRYNRLCKLARQGMLRQAEQRKAMLAKEDTKS